MTVYPSGSLHFLQCFCHAMEAAVHAVVKRHGSANCHLYRRPEGTGMILFPDRFCTPADVVD